MMYMPIILEFALHRMISGCYGSSILEKLGKLRINFHAFQATLAELNNVFACAEAGEVGDLN